MGESTDNPPSRRRAVAWGILFGYGGALLTVARNILLVPLYLQFVTIAAYGAWLATGATIIQLLVSDFGLAGVLMQRSATLHGAGDRSRLGEVMGSGMVAALILAVGLMVVGVTVIPFVPDMSGLAPRETIAVRQCLYLAVIAAGIGIAAAVAQGLLRSLQRSAAAGAIVLVSEITNIIVSTTLLFTGVGLYALVWGMLARSLLLAGASTICLLRPRDGKLAFASSRHEVRALFADTGVSFVTAFSMKSMAQANTLLVGIMLGPVSAAAYGLTVRAHETLAMFLGQMNAAFAPGMAHLWGSGNALRFRTLLLNIASGSGLLAALGIVGVICVNESFVKLWLHRDVFGGQPTSILMGLAIWISQLGYVAYDALYALGKFGYIAKTYLISASLQVVLLTCLLPLGIWAVPLVMILTAFFWGGLFWSRVRVETQLSYVDLKGICTDLLIIGCCGVAIAGAYLALYTTTDSWDGLVIRGACCALAMLGAILIVSGRIRGIVHSELRLTLRSFRARHGV